VGDHVFLKVKAKRSSLKLGNCSKLAAHYCGPFEILERIGLVAYMLALPASMCIHNVFHVSFLKKYVPNANHVKYKQCKRNKIANYEVGPNLRELINIYRRGVSLSYTKPSHLR
jgi:hypothetical protein